MYDFVDKYKIKEYLNPYVQKTIAIVDSSYNINYIKDDLIYNKEAMTSY